MSTPTIRSVPMLWIGLCLVCLGVLIWLGSLCFFMFSTFSHLESGSDMRGPVGSMWPLLLGYAASAISVLAGLVLTILGLIQYSHLFRANIDANMAGLSR